MHILLDNLGDGFITFPDFQRQLIALEREQDCDARERAQRKAEAACYATVDAKPEPRAVMTPLGEPARDAHGKLCEWFDSTAPWSHAVNTWRPPPPPTLPDFSWTAATQTRCHHGVPMQYTCKACADERANDSR